MGNFMYKLFIPFIGTFVSLNFSMYIFTSFMLSDKCVTKLFAFRNVGYDEPTLLQSLILGDILTGYVAIEIQAKLL